MTLALGPQRLTSSAGGGWENARQAAPVVASPTSGTFYVSGTSPSILPAGSDANPGTLAAPFATLNFAQSQVPAGGDYLVLCDGTFAENTSAGGRLILTRIFTKPVVFDSYSANPANFIVSNLSGTNGVINTRANTFKNYQFRRATLRATTDGCPLFFANADTLPHAGSNVGFFDCIFEARTQATTNFYAINLATDFGITALYFVRCSFKKVVGTSTVSLPVLLATTGMTLTTANQPHSDIGFWDCATTDAQWDGFGPGGGQTAVIGGINKFTFVRNNIQTGVNHSFLIGKDTSGDTTPKVTNVYVQGNTFSAQGTNPHGMLIGSNVTAAGLPTQTDGVSIKGNTITTALQGIVCKGSFNPLVQGNTVTLTPTLATGSALYAKASSGAKFRSNIVNLSGASFACIGFNENLDGSNKASNTECTNNQINASGSLAKAITWIDATGSTGGAISNDNVITLASSSTLGSVRGTTVTTQADLRAVWAAHGLAGDDPTNDSRTTVQ